MAEARPSRWGWLVAVGLFALTPVVGCYSQGVLQRAAAKSANDNLDNALREQCEHAGAEVAGIQAALHSLRDLFDASEEVTSEEFALFARRAHARHPAVIAFVWAPYETGAQPEQVAIRSPEDAMARRTESWPLEASSRVRAGAEAKLLPVSYVHPKTEAASWLGVDLASDGGRRRSLERALSSGAVVVADPEIEPDPSSPDARALLFLRTDGSSSAAGTPPQHGMLATSFSLSVLASAAEQRCAERHPPGLSFRIVRGACPILEEEPALGDEDQVEVGSLALVRLQRPIASTSGAWILEVAASEAYLSAQATAVPRHLAWVAAGAWLLFSVVVLIGGHAFRLEGLRQQSLVIERVLGSLTDGVVVADSAGRLLTANESAVRILGPPPHGADALAWFESANLVDPARNLPFARNRQLSGSAAIARMGTEQTYRCDATATRGARWITLATRALSTGRGAQDGTVTVVRDMTARHQEAERLELLSRAVEQTADMVLIADREGKVIYANPSFESVTGHARSDAVGNATFLRESLLYSFEEFERLRDTLLRGGCFKGGVTCQRKDLSTITCEQSITPLKDNSGRISHFVVVSKDMTEHNRLLANEVEMQIAVAMQRRLFPRAAVAELGIDVAGHTSPAAATSGDTYDWMVRPDGNLALVVGDVSGHGLGPAMLMSEVHAFLRCLLSMPLTLDAVLIRVHQLLRPDLPDGTFVTLFLVELNPDTRRIRYVNAGHVAGLVVGPGRAQEIRLDSSDPAIGILDTAPRYQLHEGPNLQFGDVLVLSSDGVTECPQADGTQLGEGGLARLVEKVLDRPAGEIVLHIQNRISQLNPSRSEPDDVTLLVVKMNPLPPDETVGSHESQPPN